MRTILVSTTASLLLATVALAGKAAPPAATPTASPAPAKAHAMPENMQSHTLVLLQRGPKAAQFSEKELEELQKQHLAHLTKLGNDGKIVVAGPFSDQKDESLRGACIYSVPIAEAIALAEADPMVKAGRLQVVAMTWWTEKGYMTFPKAPAK